ncbi:hypothetical protein F383_04745 [Gossypium arboreum]|uniref:Uncharacterized protein n=1 Tax=Gossypium arboreum TaxID=29729 RepID=A0A0B0PJ13_GOSAR|nr:hypothetical protein F383_04745 [Gossypium arboreum]
MARYIYTLQNKIKVLLAYTCHISIYTFSKGTKMMFDSMVTIPELPIAMISIKQLKNAQSKLSKA